MQAQAACDHEIDKEAERFEREKAARTAAAFAVRPIIHGLLLPANRFGRTAKPHAQISASLDDMPLLPYKYCPKEYGSLRPLVVR